MDKEIIIAVVIFIAFIIGGMAVAFSTPTIQQLVEIGVCVPLQKNVQNL